MNENAYITACFICKKQSNLSMIAYREEGNPYIIGWLFVCKKCLRDLVGKNLRIEIVHT